MSELLLHAQELFDNFRSVIERNQEVVSVRFEMFALEKLRSEFAGGTVSGPNLKQLIIFNQIRKYLSDIALEAGKMKPDFTLLHQLPESDLKSEFQAYVGAYNKQWAHVRSQFLAANEEAAQNESSAARKRTAAAPPEHDSEPEVVVIKRVRRVVVPPPPPPAPELPTMADRRSKRSSAAVTVKKSNEPKLDLAARGAYKRPKLSESTGAPLVVDFAKLEMSSLKKYQRYFKLDTVRPNANKEELIRAVTKHFVVEPKLREAQVISQFLFALRRDPREALPAVSQPADAASS